MSQSMLKIAYRATVCQEGFEGKDEIWGHLDESKPVISVIDCLNIEPNLNSSSESWYIWLVE